METERPWVDRKLIEFVKSNVLDPADFTIRNDGVCRLNPELARLIVRDIPPSINNAGFLIEQTFAQRSHIARFVPQKRTQHPGRRRTETGGFRSVCLRVANPKPDLPSATASGRVGRPLVASAIACRDGLALDH
jgi:hypothetical protein